MNKVKKLVSLLLVFTMVFSLFASVSFAGVDKWESVASGDILIKDTVTKIADDVYEHEVVTNNADGNRQRIDFLTEITPGDSTKIVAGYGANNADSWSLTTTSKQAEAYMKDNPGHTVVSAINADFFNMGTGEPLGALVMEGEVKHAANGRYYFGITKDGQAVIRNNEDLSDMQSAVGGDSLLINNGEIMTENTAYGDLYYSRTAIGIKADGTVVTFVTYGNRAPVSCGRTYLEIAEMLKDAGCTYALALDGGGSATLVSRPEGTTGLQLRNHPVDGAEREVSSSLLIVSTKEKTGVFSHAQLTPNNEVYTPGSEVAFSANGVDTAGIAMELPSNVSWALAEESKGLGTIDAATGVFTAGKDTGVVTVNLLQGDKIIGTTSIEIVVPDSIYFATEEVSLGFEEESDLGLVVRSKGRDVHYKDGDIKWNFVYNDEYNEKGPGKKASVTIGDLYIEAKNGGTYGNRVSVEIVNNTLEGAPAGAVEIRVYLDDEQKEVFYVQDGRTNGQVASFPLTSISNLISLKSAYIDFYRVSDGSNTITLQEKVRLTGGEVPTLSDVGSWENNIFTSKNSTAKGVATATSAYDSSVSGNIRLIVGMLPTVVWDFEDTIANDGSQVSAENYYTGYTAEDGTTVPGILSTSNYGRGGKQSIEIVSLDNDEPVRFGQKALKLNYDFRDCLEVTEGACLGTTSGMAIPGVPTGIGVWVYAPEGVGIDWQKDENGATTQAGFWLRGYVKDGTGANVPYDFTFEPKVCTDENGQIPGIYWEGWKYLEADLTKLQAPYSIQPGMTFRLMFVHGTRMGTRTANSIYFDNLQFVYGTNVDDIDNPLIDSITVNGKELVEDAVVDTNVLNIDSIVSDVQNKYTTGVDASTVRMYIDGVNVVDNEKYEYQYADSIAHLYNLKLKDGSHSITVTVRDGFGNETSETRNFVVDTEVQAATDVEVVAAGDAILGGTIDLQVKASDATVKENSTTFRLGNQFKEYEVIYSDNYDGETTYRKLAKTITLKATRKDGANEDDDNVIATLRVKIPSTLLESDKFSYTVKGGSFETFSGQNDTYSTKEIEMPIMAGYSVFAEPIIVGGEAGILQVEDAEGNPASGVTLYLAADDTVVGVTDENGQVVTEQFNAASGEYSAYAKDESGMLSFRYKFYAYDPQGDLAGAAHNVRFNATDDAATKKNITWMSNPLSEGSQILQYTVKGTDAWTTVEVDNTQVEFGYKGFNVADVNAVLLEELEPGTAYDYKVGTEGAMSDVKTFSTEAANRKDSKFFILGDIQDPDKTNLATIVDKLNDVDYNFGIQIGDAIDQANDYTDWADLGDIVGEKMLADTDMLTVMGNHEYYGDEDASISSAIYNNPTTAAGSYYSVENGNIYMAVINFCDNTNQIKAATEWLKEDAAKSDAIWKIVVTHQPAYFTNSVGGNDPVYDYLPDACEAGGIDAVFSGHDHAFARTNPLIDDQIDEENGIVYYVTGAIGSKRYPVSTQDKFDFNTIFKYMSDGFTATYLTVESDMDEMTIKMFELGNDEPVNVHVIKSECAKNDHKYVYDVEEDVVKCSVCKEEKKEFTGDVKDKDGNEYYFIAGKKQTGWVTVGEEVRYYTEAGIREKVTADETPSTCTMDGWCHYTSESGEKYYERYNDAGGHEYETKDGKRVCSVCGWTRINMSECSVKLSFNECTYSGYAKKPSTTVTNPTGTVLYKDDTYVKEYSTKYSDNIEIGTATVTLSAKNKAGYVNVNEWRGSYYGSTTVTFDICPDAPKNAVVGRDNDKATLVWDAAKYAEEYVIYQSADGGKTYREVGTTTMTEYIATGLDVDKDYTFRVGSRAIGLNEKQEEQAYDSISRTKAYNLKPSVKVSYNANGKPVLEWTDKDGAEYQIYRATSKSGKYAKLYTTKGGRFTNKSATPGKTYYYKVVAKLDNCTSTSKIYKVTVRCEKPEVTTKYRTSDGKPKLVWNNVDSAVKYNVYRSASGKEGTFKKVFTTTGTSYVNTSATPGKTYYYKVAAVEKTTSASTFSEVVQKTCKPAKVKASGYARDKDGKPRITWSKVNGAVIYEVYRSTTGKEGTFKKQFETSKTSYNNTAAKAKKTYYYKVRAVTKNGVKGYFSNVVKVKCTSK